MTKVVLDASALLAYLNEEPGADMVSGFLGDALMSAVNFAEAMSKLIARVGSLELATTAMNVIEVDVVDFDRRMAEDVGALAALTRKMGLSLGDRACIALAARENIPALTGDRAWSRLELGVEIKLIR